MIPRIRRPGHSPGHCTFFVDSRRGRDYIDAMANQSDSSFENELKRLEERVDALVRVCDQLQDEIRRITDPRELDIPNVGLVSLADAETGRVGRYDTGSSE